MSSTYFQAIDLNNIRLHVQRDYYLYFYLVLLVLFAGVCLQLSGLSFSLQLLVFVVFCLLLLFTCLRLPSLFFKNKVRTLHCQHGQWFLLLDNAKRVDLTLSRQSVVTHFALFLFFTSQDQQHYPIILRRGCVNSMEYDALYVYLLRVWQKEKLKAQEKK